MAGRKRALGIEGSGAHTRQDAGKSKGSLSKHRSHPSRPISRRSKPSGFVSTGIPHLIFSFQP